MILKHLNLTVNDVDASRQFLETYFSMTCVGSRGKGFAAMFDEDQFVLTLMKGKDVQYPSILHIGFPQESREKVDQINQLLKDDGYELDHPIESHGYTFYVQAASEFTVEILSE